MDIVYTTNLKAACALSALGFQHRDPQPIEKINNTFWFFFEREAKRGRAKKDGLTADKYLVAWDKAWTEYTIDENHPFYDMRAALDNRDTFVYWMKNSVISTISKEFGDRTLVIPANASPKLKGWVRKML